MLDRRIPLLTAAALALLALSACGGDAPEEGAGATSGRVLPGSISDEMLPLDQVTSQPPLLAPEASPGGTGTPAADADTPEGEAADAGEEPAAEASPEPAQDAETE